MARAGLTMARVRACRDELLAQGRYPSVDAVRLALGSGSKSTIHRLLKELGAEGADGGAARHATARALHALVEELAERLHQDAERRHEDARRGMQDLRAQCAAHEAALQDKERQLAALRATVAGLNARLERLQRQADGGGAPAAPGHGDFGGLLSNPYPGARGASPFSIVLSSGRSDVFDVGRLGPAGPEFR